MTLIKETILDHLPFRRRQTPSGWISFNAVCCDDKGNRGGLIFDNDTLSYTDSQFGAIGTIELLNGMNTDVITPIRYDRFTQETNYTAARYEERKIKYHSEAIQIQTYQAMPVTLMSLSLYLNEFKGKIEILGTKNEIIGNEAFLNAKILYSSNFTLLQNGPLLVPNLDVEELTYLRVSYEKTAGKIDYIKIHN